MDPSNASSHSIDISANSKSPQDPLLSSIEVEMETYCSSVILFKVPDEFRKDNGDDVFVPAKVSIGPFHHGSPHLKSMDDQKRLYLCAFLRRYPSVNLQKLLGVIEESHSRLRKCYEVEFKLDDHEFKRIMLLDCCFVLELLLQNSNEKLRRRNDPIFTTPDLLSDLKCDMILLENQVPFFLLKELFNCVENRVSESLLLNELAFRFFKTMVTGDRQFVYDNFIQDADHLLDMVYSCFLPTYPRVETKKQQAKPKDFPHASILQSQGFRFKAAKDLKSVLDIQLRNSVLEIPPLKVYPRIEKILKNFIAYELCQFGSARQVSSYVNFMSHLLQYDEDVTLLCRCKILDEKQEIGNLKWMCQHKSSLSNTYFAGIAQNLTERPNRSVKCLTERPNRSVKWFRTLRRNPVAIGAATIWVVIVIFVAAFFSALSFLQHRRN